MVMKAKKKSARATKKHTARKDAFRIDLLVKAQQKVAVHFGHYLLETSGLVTKNAYNPSEWFKAYAKMWTHIANDLGSLAKEF